MVALIIGVLLRSGLDIDGAGFRLIPIIYQCQVLHLPKRTFLKPFKCPSRAKAGLSPPKLEGSKGRVANHKRHVLFC